jgi:large subunit ribosomal protein L9
MKIILLNNIEKLGEIGSIIEVKNGYAKNYLIPKKKALIANNKNIILQKKNLLNKDINEKTKYKITQNLSNTSILISATSKDNNELYAPINSITLTKIFKKLDLNIKKNNLSKNLIIKNIGSHKIDVKLKNNDTYNIYIKILKK